MFGNQKFFGLTICIYFSLFNKNDKLVIKIIVNMMKKREKLLA